VTGRSSIHQRTFIAKSMCWGPLCHGASLCALSNLGYRYTCKVLHQVELFGKPRKSLQKDPPLGNRILVIPIDRLCIVPRVLSPWVVLLSQTSRKALNVKHSYGLHTHRHRQKVGNRNLVPSPWFQTSPRFLFPRDLWGWGGLLYRMFANDRKACLTESLSQTV
jgi:hypothetical protein